MGDRRLTVFGESFGTLIGQTYANLFPRRVRAMALDGLEDPVASAAGMEAILASGLADTDRVFRRYLALCEGPAPTGVPWPAMASQWRRGSHGCWRGCATIRCPRPRPTRLGS